jgi:hypothetical protein
MKQSSAANIAIIFAVLAWPLSFYGVLSQLGDYSPDTPYEVMNANRFISNVVLCVGVLCVPASFWLSGFSYTGAKFRSIIAAVTCACLIAVSVLTTLV